MLITFNLWTTGASHAATDRAKESWIATNTLQQAKFAASEEHSLELEYRLLPGPRWRTKDTEASALLVSSLENVLAMRWPRRQA